MKIPFDLEKAKNGAKVVTRDGRQVEILKYDYMYRGVQKIAYCYTDETGDNHLLFVNTDGIFLAGREEDDDLLIEVDPTYRPYANAAECRKEAIMNNEIKQLTDLQIAEIAAKYFNDCEDHCEQCDHCMEYWSAVKALQILREQEGGAN